LSVVDFLALSLVITFVALTGAFLTFALFAVSCSRFCLFVIFGIFGGLFATIAAKVSKALTLLLLCSGKSGNAAFLLLELSLGSSLLGEIGEANLLFLAVLPHSLLLFVPVLDVVKDLLFVDVGDAIVLGELLGEERLATAGLARDGNLEGLQAALLAELVFDPLDVHSQTALAVPVEAAFAQISLSFAFLTGALLLGDEDLRRLDLDAQHNEALPIEVQVQRRLLGVHRRVLQGDIDRLDQAGADAVGDRLNKFPLGRLLGVVNTENVALLGGLLGDFLDHASQVFHVDSRHEVFAFTHHGELLRVLLPRALEMVIEDALAETVKHTSRDDISLHALLLEAENSIFDFLDFGILAARLALFEISLSEWVVQEASLSTDRLGLGFLFFLILILCSLFLFAFRLSLAVTTLGLAFFACCALASGAL